MRKILYSSFLVVAVVAVAGYATYSYFSDTETSTGNTFTAGAIDLTVMQKSSGTLGSCTFQENWTTGGPIFSCNDVKPGDKGEATVKFNLTSNPAWGCLQINNLVDSDNTCVEPEIAAESVCQPTGNGELDNHLKLTVWMDDGAGDSDACDNIQGSNEEVVVNGAYLSSFPSVADGYVLPIAAPSGALRNNPIPAGEHCIGIKWEIPSDTGNDTQTDQLGGDLVFYVEQSRNNDHFTCANHFTAITSQQTLTLEDETINPTGPWTPITNNARKAILTWQGDGATFNYSLNAQSLDSNTNYSLIYYADPWPGNHPGKLIGTFSTDSSGNYNGSANVDLGMDLPDPADANFGTGAKLWIVLSNDYNGTNAMTAWQPEKYLFEGNVYIHYNDTNN